MRARKPRPAPHSNRMPGRAGTKRAMEPLMLFVLVLLLLVLGLPIAVALGLSSVLFLLLFSTDSLASLALKLFQAQQHYTLLAIHYSILSSAFLSTGGVAQRIIRCPIAVVRLFTRRSPLNPKKGGA